MVLLSLEALSAPVDLARPELLDILARPELLEARSMRGEDMREDVASEGQEKD